VALIPHGIGRSTRLVRAFPVCSNVRLWALEPHDLALTKLERSIERDIRDVIVLAQAGLIDRHALVARFEAELEPYITGSASASSWNGGSANRAVGRRPARHSDGSTVCTIM
jgi:hypothetical protein